MRILSAIALALATMASLPAQAQSCPPADTLQDYVDTALRLNQGGELRMYYRLLKAFDAAKPTLLVINGGPGGDHGIVRSFNDLADEMNVLSFDHRGLGCTKIQSRHNGGFDEGLFSMDRAADDLDALRKKLLGNDGKWWVYGVSYGGMLGQKYVIKYPGHIEGVILDSTFHRSTAIDVARKQYVQLFIESDAEVKALFDQVVEKYPDARLHFLRRIWGLTYSYAGRTEWIKSALESILSATSQDDARSRYTSDIFRGPVAGMSYDIICSEIWDWNDDAAYRDYYFAAFGNNCGPYQSHRKPMDWAEDLKLLKVRTFLWAGTFDPVTPAAVMREMKDLIPDVVFYENAHSGHGLWFEKPECTRKLARQFFAKASTAELKATIDDALCQGVPETESIMNWADLTGQQEASF